MAGLSQDINEGYYIALGLSLATEGYWIVPEEVMREELNRTSKITTEITLISRID